MCGQCPVDCLTVGGFIESVKLQCLADLSLASLGSRKWLMRMSSWSIVNQ